LPSEREISFRRRGGWREVRRPKRCRTVPIEKGTETLFNAQPDLVSGGDAEPSPSRRGLKPSGYFSRPCLVSGVHRWPVLGIPEALGIEVTSLCTFSAAIRHRAACVAPGYGKALLRLGCKPLRSVPPRRYRMRRGTTRTRSVEGRPFQLRRVHADTAQMRTDRPGAWSVTTAEWLVSRAITTNDRGRRRAPMRSNPSRTAVVG
jgi:hypothetical protein